jgi:hypothetical protein
MKILLADFSTRVGKEDVFKLTFRNESLQENSNDNGVRVVLINLATSKDHTIKSKMFPCCNSHNSTWTSPDGKPHNQITHFLIDRWQHSSLIDSYCSGQQIVISGGDKS